MLEYVIIAWMMEEIIALYRGVTPQGRSILAALEPLYMEKSVP